MIRWFQDVVMWVHNTYNVNPYIFIVIYVISIPVYWWGIYEIVAGTPINIKCRKFVWPRIMKGVIINRVAWISPYFYVMIVARSLPRWIWIFLFIMIFFSSSYLFLQIKERRMRDKLPKFLKKRLND